MTQVTAFRANVYFLKPEEGGRRTPIFTGYRPSLYFGLRGSDGGRLYNDCVITLEGRDQVLPGTKCYARITPFRPELLQDVLKPNVTFEMTEGARIVVRGTIVEVFHN